MSEDKRRYERLPVELEGEVSAASDHNFYTGFTQNISEGGLFIATSHLHPLGTPLEFSFTLDDGPEPIQARGLVRWVREPEAQSPMPTGMGVEFESLSAAELKRVQAYIARRRETIFYDDD